MEQALLHIASKWQHILGLMLIFGGVFTLLSSVWACNPNQRRPTAREILVDACYYFLMPLLDRYIWIAVLVGTATLLVTLQGGEVTQYLEQGYGPLHQWPLWLQVVLVLLIQDFYLYWMHRSLHRLPLWRYHMIHHAPKELYWHSAARFHPVNRWLSFAVADALVVLLGFSPESVLVMANVNAFWSALVHSNLRWDFGPFRYVLSSPIFHRWHHTAPKHGGMKNFAPTFPFIDLMFGTFYMPKGKLPTEYGVHEDVPESFIGQMLHPFRRAKLTNENDGK